VADTKRHNLEKKRKEKKEFDSIEFKASPNLIMFKDPFRTAQ